MAGLSRRVEPFVFALADGSPLRVAPGRTVVELPSDKAGVILR